MKEIIGQKIDWNCFHYVILYLKILFLKLNNLKYLISAPLNARYMEIIESALFVFTLDSYCPVSPDDCSKTLHIGNMENKFEFIVIIIINQELIRYL